MRKPTEHQVDRLYERLTAKERAKLRIRWWQEDREDDPALRKATPFDQYDDLNACVEAVMEAHQVLAMFALWLGERVGTVKARMGMVAAFRLWLLQAERLRWAIRWDLPEVVTESEHARRLAETREQRFPVYDCSVLLADIDLDDEEMENDRQQWEGRIRKALRAKELRATKQGIRHGELMDWAGRDVVVCTDSARDLAVLPDSVADYVEQARAARDALLALADEAPRDAVAEGQASRMEKLREAVLRGIVRDLGECELARRSLEEVAAWVAEDFDGDDVVHPLVRDMLDQVRDAIAGMIVELEEREGWTVEMPGGSDGDFVEKLKRRIARSN